VCVLGGGSQVRIGVDALMCFNHDTFLLGDLVQYMRENEKLTLNLVNKPEETTLWKQGWLNSVDLGLDGP